MNPDKGTFHDEAQLKKMFGETDDGTPKIPLNWPTFAKGEQVTVKGHPFKVVGVDMETNVLTLQSWHYKGEDPGAEVHALQEQIEKEQQRAASMGNDQRWADRRTSQRPPAQAGQRPQQRGRR